jgi:HK97 family phage portal protein
MAEPNRYIPLTSLTAHNKPGWRARLLRGIAARIDPEVYEQGAIGFDRYGVRNVVRGKSGAMQFGEFSNSGGNQFVIERPGGGLHINPAKALANNRGFVFASVNAIAREVMTIDWRLFEVNGKNHKEKTEHEVLDLLDTVNDNMTSLELKYLISASLTLTGNTYIFLEGVKDDLSKPKALHLMPPDRVRPVLDRRSWPYQLVGYRMKLENIEMAFKPYEVIHMRLPNPSDFFEGMSPVQAGAEYIDNDNYAQEFNRKFFKNGARPAGFLETEMIAETQIEALKFGFADMHEGIDNMNRIGVLPKGVKWVGSGASPKDMDFKNLSEDSKQRILAMFGVSRTILGTAESDTNRATAETADYVFSKRVVKPHMLLICAFLNERLIPRYADNIYLSFIDPVPEDRAARTDEMAKASGGVPIITQNEARDEFMGLGPTEGGDVLLIPNTMTPAGAKPEVTPVADVTKPGKAISKEIEAKHLKAANGERVAYRPARTRLQERAKQRSEIATSLAESIKEKLAEKLALKKFGSTKEEDEAAWKPFSERTHKAEQEIAETIRKINAEQQTEVMKHLPRAIEKAIDPRDLFDIEKWISITTDALTHTFEDLFSHEAKVAAEAIGKPNLNPFSDTAATALHNSIAMMSKSYQTTVLANLEEVINTGLSLGQGLTELSKGVAEVYGAADGYGAERIAKTEAFRTSNMALKDAWQQSGVVKTIKWYTGNNPCPFCQEMNGKIISIDDNFFNNGDSLTVGTGDSAQIMSLDYGDVGTPPLHPNCMCFVRPEDVSLD